MKRIHMDTRVSSCKIPILFQICLLPLRIAPDQDMQLCIFAKFFYNQTIRLGMWSYIQINCDSFDLLSLVSIFSLSFPIVSGHSCCPLHISTKKRSQVYDHHSQYAWLYHKIQLQQHPGFYVSMDLGSIFYSPNCFLGRPLGPTALICILFLLGFSVDI